MRKGIVNSKTKVLVLSIFLVLALVGFASAKADNLADGTLTISGQLHSPCNQGVGNGADMCDPGRSDQGNPFNSNDELGGVPGAPGRQGGNGK